jgi:hypothetical protein
MQKKLLTLAVAGALAAPGAALAQVEVYGFISVAVQNFKYGESTSGLPSVSKWDVSSHGSNYGIRGRENLGGGLTAWFQIEQNAPMERSNNVAITPASRNTAVGLQGSWGNFFIGQWTTPWADLESLWSIGSVGRSVAVIIGRRETPARCRTELHPGGHVSTPWDSVLVTVCDPRSGRRPGRILASGLAVDLLIPSVSAARRPACLPDERGQGGVRIPGVVVDPRCCRRRFSGAAWAVGANRAAHDSTGFTTR